jgi:pyruvate dehydrogenase E2 component (dihydrolipoamide acetyltransferase)
MDVRLPKLGENAEGGAVVSILVKEGETVTQGQTILELENEKAVAPIPSTAAGVIAKIRVKEGDRVNVGQVLITVEEAAGAEGKAPAAAPAKSSAPVAAATPARAAAKKAAAPPAESADDTEAVTEDTANDPAEPTGPVPPASPEIRRISRELGLDLRRVRASGPGGRVEWGDLRSYLQRLQRAAAQPRPSAAPAAAPAAPAPEPIDFSKWGPVTRQPLSVLRKTIARRMTESWHAVPRVTQFDEADITDLMALRKKFAQAYEAKGARLTLTSFALRAVARTLRQHPIFNSSLDLGSNELVLKDYVHLGLAVDTEQGLLVPVIRHADQKSLFDLSKDVQDFAEKARERKLALDDMKGGTFTISNQGGIGGGHFTPIVNTPEVAILGLGKGAMKPVVRAERIEPRLMMPLAVAYDHRVIDGGTAARFAVDLVAAFQSFTEADLAL